MYYQIKDIKNTQSIKQGQKIYIGVIVNVRFHRTIINRNHVLVYI